MNNNISPKNIETIANHLNILLATEVTLYIKTLNYHWNVKDSYFSAVHEFFKKQYEEIFLIIDAVAERIATLGHYAYGTLEECKQHSLISEQVQEKLNTKQKMSMLLENHERIISHLRLGVTLTNDLNDMGTNNFLAELLEKHEKMAWMLRSHIINN